jgi:hypothetical protein
MGVALERWRIKWSGETGGENEYSSGRRIYAGVTAGERSGADFEGVRPPCVMEAVAYGRKKVPLAT